ncbi:histidine kinase HHK3 [Penicillium angulare]|uniref:histidine kinase n=1 Tax=Penicillium angulare TaxID=116970 RepID=A0A9W9KQF3_9EURO|nr:histidine kinase HHK3 [Penicillium angulare]
MARSGRPAPFFPKVDEAILTSKHPPPLFRPQAVGPIFDRRNYEEPISPWSSAIKDTFYPDSEAYGRSKTPEKPRDFDDEYLRAFLADNERLRLSVLWYFTRDVIKEDEFLSGLQQKVHLAQESAGWEFAVIGILDVDMYTRLATVGLELGNLPRGETICAHTVTQPPGNVFLLPNLMEDWRFQRCPYLESGGLVAYAGVPLRIQTESGDCVSLGSLCVASSEAQEPLSKAQHQTLVQLADWVVSDLVQCTRARRQRERHRMSELLSKVQKETNDAGCADPILDVLKTIYPDVIISLQSSGTTHVQFDGGYTVPVIDLEDGLWEDFEYLDELIEKSNHLPLPSDRPVRILTAECESISGSSLLVVASKDFHLVFDDVDSWFVHACANAISQTWHQSLLAEALKAKDKFLRGFSHQLRTPVHGILGSVELLTEELRSRSLEETPRSLAQKNTTSTNSNEPLTYLNTIKMAGQDLTSIINNLITLNKWSDIAVAERNYGSHTLDELEAELESEINKFTQGDTRYTTSIFLTHSLSTARGSFRIDLQVLQDTLLPLITNAIQNTAQGNILVLSSIDSDAKSLIVDIKDTGSGIHPGSQRRIFEAYEKVDGHTAGAGLGLTLASKFSSLINGSVKLVTSEIGCGSHFRAAFKLIEFEPASASQQPISERLSPLPPKYFSMKAQGDELSSIHHFEKFLAENSFCASDSTEDCFIILEATSDLGQHRANMSKIAHGQVAICLITESEEKQDIKSKSNNIICLNSPFTTSALYSALEEAQQYLMTHLSKSLPLRLHPGNILPLEESNIHQIEYESSDLYFSTPISKEPGITTTECSQSPANVPGNVELGIPIRSLSISSQPLTLIVDDNLVNLRVMETYCRKRGLPYLSAVNGLEAFGIFSQHQARATTENLPAVELILMDLQMPVCGGIEASKRIRSFEQQNKCTKSFLFVLTGQDSVADRKAADSAGADEYFVKPVVLKQLDQVIQQYFPAFSPKN